jgi:2-phospho-L-lactate transferase/gluconeogenesis factor (CofD/UPF0052 family)
VAYTEVNTRAVRAQACLYAVEHALVPMTHARVQLHARVRGARTGPEPRDAGERVRREAQLARVRAELERVVRGVC